MRKVAVYTVVRNEGRLLQKWLDYYMTLFGEEHTFILDNDTDDGSTENLPCNVIRISCGVAYNNAWLCDQVRSFQQGLLSSGYDYVVFADCDEFLWHPMGLMNYVQKLKKPDVMAVGFDLIHMPYEEPTPFDYNQKIMSQRAFWFRSPTYNKTLISNHPLEWRTGLHRANNSCGFQDQDLLLVHVHRFDYWETLRRHELACNMPWHQPELDKGFHHARSVGDEYREWYFYSRLYKRNFREIPEHKLPPIEHIPPELLSKMKDCF